MRGRASAQGVRRWFKTVTAGTLVGAMLALAVAVLPVAPTAPASAAIVGDVCDPNHPEYDLIYTGAISPVPGRWACGVQEAALRQLIEDVWGWPYTAQNRRIALVHHRPEVAAALWLELLATWEQIPHTDDYRFSNFRANVVEANIFRPIARAGLEEFKLWDSQKCDYVPPPGFEFNPCPWMQEHMVAMWRDNDHTKMASPTRDELLVWGQAVATETGTFSLGDTSTRRNTHAGLRALRQQLAEFHRQGIDRLADNNEGKVDAVAALTTATAIFASDEAHPEVQADRVGGLFREMMVEVGHEVGSAAPLSVKQTLELLSENTAFKQVLPGGKFGPESLISFPNWVQADALHYTFSTLAFFLYGVHWTSPLSEPAPDTADARWFKVTAGNYVRVMQDLPLRVGFGDTRVSARLLNDGTWVTTPSGGSATFSRELVYTAPAGDLKSLGVTPDYLRLLDLRGNVPGLPSCTLTPGCVISPFFWARVSDEFDHMVPAKIEFLGQPMTLTDHVPLPATETLGALTTTSVRAIASYDTEYAFEWEIRRNGGFVALIETDDDPDDPGAGGVGTLEHRFMIPGDYTVTMRAHTLQGEVSEPWVQEVHVPVPDGWTGQVQNDLTVTVHPQNWDGSSAPSTMPEGPWDEYSTEGTVCLLSGVNANTDYSVGFGGLANLFGTTVVDATSDQGFTCFNRNPDASIVAGAYEFAARTFTTEECVGVAGTVTVRKALLGTGLEDFAIACNRHDVPGERFTLEVTNQDPTTPDVVTRWGAGSEQDLSTDTGTVVGEIGDEIELAIKRTGGIAERLTYEITWADGTFDTIQNIGCANAVDRCAVSHVFDAPVTGVGATVVAVDRAGSRSPVATQHFRIIPGPPSITDRATDLSDNNLATLTGVVVDPWHVATSVVVDWQDGTTTEEHQVPLPVDAEGRFHLEHQYGYRGDFAPTFTFKAGSQDLGTVTWETITTANFLPIVVAEPITSDLNPDPDGPWQVGAWVLGYDPNPADSVGVCVVWDYEFHPTVPTSQNPAVPVSPDDSDSCTAAGGEYFFFPDNATSFGDYVTPGHTYAEKGYYTIAFFPVDLEGGNGANRNVGVPTFRTIAAGVSLNAEQQHALLPQATGEKPIILGIPAVGQVLTAQIGAWEPNYTFPLSFSYQWLRDGVPIHDVDWGEHDLLYDDPAYDWPSWGPLYTVQPADQGKEISVRVRSVSPETQSLRLTSDPVSVVYDVTWDGLGLGLQVDDVDAATRTVTVSGAFLDEGGYVESTFIDWGDGTEPEPFTATGWGFGYHDFELSHTYASAGEYEITATLVNDVGGKIPATVVAEVPPGPAPVAPALQVSKHSPADAVVGTEAEFTFAVSHHETSDGTPVAIASVVDDVAGTATYSSGDAGVIGSLEAGETWLYTATHTFAAGDEGDSVSTVRVAGVDADGGDVEATAVHTTVVNAPTPAPKEPATWTSLAATVDAGTFTVQLQGAFDDPDGWVESGEIAWGGGGSSAIAHTGGAFTASWTYAGPGTYEIAATLTGPEGATRVETTQVVVPTLTSGVAPAIQVVTSGPADAVAGTAVDFSFAVSHHESSDGTAVGITSVIDDAGTAADYVSGDADDSGFLEDGETWVYAVSRTFALAEVGTVATVATVTGIDADDQPVGATATHAVDVTAPPKAPATWTSLAAAVQTGTLYVELDGEFADADGWVESGEIAWGDGNTSAISHNDGVFIASHTYAADGSYEITATLVGPEGATRVEATQVVVPPLGGGGTPEPDLDGDGIPDAIDPDIDGDGVINERDADPWDPDVSDIVPLPEDEVIEGGVGAVTGPATASPGDKIHLGVEGAAPGTQFWAFLHSDPVALGPFSVGSPGTTVTIPANTTLGAHLIAVYDATGVLVGYLPITIVPAAGTGEGPGGDSDAGGGPGTGQEGARNDDNETLPDTGYSSAPAAVLAVLLALLGAAALVTRRRLGER